MHEKKVTKPLGLAAGTVIVTALAAVPPVNAAENPFSMQPLSSGYMVAMEGKCGEGKCGEGKCGGAKASDDGKAQDRQCRMHSMDADSDGKISREEFMTNHDAKFDRIDANGDGMLDEGEFEAYRAEKYGKRMEGKCGEGRCGGNK